MQTENDLLTSFQKLFYKKDASIVVGIGDDAAITTPSPDMKLVYTCDSQVENTHFKTTQIHPHQLGFRAMSAGVSDIIAMGATPKYCLSSLFVPNRPERNTWMREINKGILEACSAYNTTIIGGNVTKSALWGIDIMAIGEVDTAHLLLKKGARVGDTVFVTGFLGDAHTGWELLQHPQIPLSKKHKQYLLTHHFKPTAKVKEGIILASLKVVTAMTDMSDGLATDVLHLCDASSVGVTIEAKHIPISPAVKAYGKIAGKNPLMLALEGGEDFGLCFTAPARYERHIIDTIKEKIGITISVIGKITPKKQGKILVSPNGEKIKLEAIGFDNLA
ncbi:MAG: thiamine-phosphate kinase [Candidatus Levybacteria bacterium]|nr:thiamine-phosphate kinase [Candidatus Levybacteria bacterium]